VKSKYRSFTGIAVMIAHHDHDTSAQAAGADGLVKVDGVIAVGEVPWLKWVHASSGVEKPTRIACARIKPVGGR
jgi:hypothetical protein